MASGVRAVVLAGGKGTRLRPYTAHLPKPLVPVGDRPILDIVLRQLRTYGFNRVTVTTGYLGGLIEAYFGDGEDQGVCIDYFRENEPLGTVGSLAQLKGLDDDFLVLNGDVLTDLDYRSLYKQHKRDRALITVATCSREVQISLGVLRHEDETDTTRVTAYVEKPTIAYEASMGIYCMSPAVIDFITPGEYLDFPTLVHRLLDAGQVVRAARSDCYWRDIGTLEDYERALEEIDDLNSRLRPGDPSGSLADAP
ncbi:MAG: sugar phosphate nucleotidyltransferase [Actinomycetota bacterium]|nr:sugar phosphate nucleotidyltransferase [Actinomycetota bacterium]